MSGSDTIQSAEDNAKYIIADITSDLLDSSTEEFNNSTYVASIESDEVLQRKIIVGRGDDWSESDSEYGFSYMFRAPERRQNPNVDTEYIYGKYGWNIDAQGVLDEAPRLRQLFEQGVESDLLDETQLERFDMTIDALEDAFTSGVKDVSLSEIQSVIEDHDADQLKRLVGSDDEERAVLWQLLHSKNEEGEIIDNPVSIEYIDEDIGLMFARSERFYHDEYDEPDGKWYAFGIVIGIDDTDARFFAHRLSSDPDLRNPDFDWTLGALKEKMGFDMYFDDMFDPEDIPFDNRILVQGDVALVRRDYQSELWEHYENTYETEKSNLTREAAKGELTEQDDAEWFQSKTEDRLNDVDKVHVSSHSGNVRVSTGQKTDELKELQTEVDLTEEEVRDEQERRGIKRLSSQKRTQIIEDLLNDRVYNWVCERRGVSPEEHQDTVESQVTEEFENTNKQVNLVLGNHVIFLGPAREHPDEMTNQDRDALETVVVPTEADGLVWHGEHENKKIQLPKGVYEFHFLEGHETQFWM
jgi:hypothetical protein